MFPGWIFDRGDAWNRVGFSGADRGALGCVFVAGEWNGVGGASRREWDCVEIGNRGGERAVERRRSLRRLLGASLQSIAGTHHGGGWIGAWETRGGSGA